MNTFQYSSEIIERFPGVVGGIIIARGMRNQATPEPLLAAYLQEQERVKKSIGDTSLSEIAALAAWRSAFRAFDVNPTQYRNAAEALLRRLTKKGDIPSINTLVDIGNFISIRHALPVAVLDAQRIQGAITVRFARGDEPFTNLGEAEPEHPQAGEVIFVDETEAVIARRWCWRQSEQSAAQLETSDAIFTIEAHHLTGRQDITVALNTLQKLLTTYTGGTFVAGIVDARTPAITA